MSRADSDTIAAIATPPGQGGVGIVRISGPTAPQVAQALLGKLPKPRMADYLPFHDGAGELLDMGIALFFPGPNSFTGDDVLELQGHGGPVVQDLILKAVLSQGVRLARPGEFSERAFLNGKLDLAQAEAIADLIESGSSEAARSALRSLKGEFSDRINQLVEQLTQLRIYVEAAIDFPEEEIDFLADQRIQDDIERLQTHFDEILASAQQGCLLREGMTVVIAGQPNAGKSSLLNALAGSDTAIVTELPGTTRDLLKEQINLDGMPLHIIDTAGLRESGDVIEQEGMRRAWAAIEQADRVLLVVDDAQGVTAEDEAIVDKLPHHIPVTVIHNKIDISGRSAGLGEEALGAMIALSAKQGDGISMLRKHLEEVMGFSAASGGVFMARRRHLDALNRARDSVIRGHAALMQHQAGELLAEDLRQGQQALGEITGEVTSDDLLGRIFTSFCIGK